MLMMQWHGVFYWLIIVLHILHPIPIFPLLLSRHNTFAVKNSHFICSQKKFQKLYSRFYHAWKNIIIIRQKWIKNVDFFCLIFFVLKFHFEGFSTWLFRVTYFLQIRVGWILQILNTKAKSLFEKTNFVESQFSKVKFRWKSVLGKTNFAVNQYWENRILPKIRYRKLKFLDKFILLT